MSPDTKACPWCGETILVVARKCKHCGEYLDTASGRDQLMPADERPLPKPPRPLAVPFSGDSARPSYQPSTFRKVHGWFVVLYGLSWFLLLGGLVFLLSAYRPAPGYQPYPLAVPRPTDFAALDREELYQQVGLLWVAASVLPNIIGLVFFLVLLYKAWNLIQDGYARTSAGKAVGFLFIPFFNFYWVFVAVRGLALDLNFYAQRHGIRIRPVPAGLALAYCIGTVCSAIPGVNLLLMLPLAVLLFLLAGSVKNAAVAIAEAEKSDETASPPRRGGAVLALAAMCGLIVLATSLALFAWWPARPALILHGHTRIITHAVFSPDGKRLASASWDGTVRVWNLSAGGAETPCLVLPLGRVHVQRVAFSPDGQRLATASWDADLDHRLPGDLKVWDAANGRELLNLTGHRRQVDSIAFSPDGKYLVSASKDYDVKGNYLPGEIKVWDAATGKALPSLKGHSRPANWLTFSADGRLASAGSDGAVKVWDLTTSRVVVTCGNNRSGSLNCVVFSPDGKLLASSGYYGEAVKIWDAASGQEVSTLGDRHYYSVHSLSFSPDGSFLAFDSSNRSEVWAHVERKKSFTFKGTRPVFSPDGRRLVTIRGEQVHLWDFPPK